VPLESVPVSDVRRSPQRCCIMFRVMVGLWASGIYQFRRDNARAHNGFSQVSGAATRTVVACAAHRDNTCAPNHPASVPATCVCEDAASVPIESVRTNGDHASAPRLQHAQLRHTAHGHQSRSRSGFLSGPASSSQGDHFCSSRRQHLPQFLIAAVMPQF
jgi:hypothetical protein